jgi:hypothetical protein
VDAADGDPATPNGDGGDGSEGDMTGPAEGGGGEAAAVGPGGDDEDAGVAGWIMLGLLAAVGGIGALHSRLSRP